MSADAAQLKTVPAALERLSNQPRVRDFLTTALGEGRLAHAYLFLGAPGSGMENAALALAQCLVCPAGGDGSCDECIRVAHRTHPDVHWLRPESATGYLVSQIRSVIEDTRLAPVRARVKLYIFQDAGMLRAASANALLKTIEEPPDGVYFILIAQNAEQMLQTIVSRCQAVPFRTLPAAAAEQVVTLSSGATPEQARIALSVAGTPERAAALLASSPRRETRRLMVRTLGELAHDDSWDVIVSAREIVEGVRASGAPFKEKQEAQEEEKADYLGAAALKRLRDADRRELSARERSGMIEALAAAESLLRDVLVRVCGVNEPMVNEDAAEIISRIANGSTPEGVVRALEAVSEAKSDLASNVDPQLVFETMLLCIKEALACPPSYR